MAPPGWENVERDAPAELVAEARRSVGELRALIDDVGAKRSTATIEMFVHVRTGSEPQLRRQVELGAEAGRPWVYFMYDSEKGIAFPVSQKARLRRRADPELVFMPLHTRLTAWWLAQAWRADELAEATMSAWEASRPVSAATLARALLETAAVLHHDAQRLQEAWQKVKASGPPRVGTGAVEGFADLELAINLHELGGVSGDALPDLKAALAGKRKRRSVLTDVGKLAKTLSSEVAELYEWLSNVAHPSFGTMLAYGSPMHVHDTGTHSLRVVAGDPSIRELRELRSTRAAAVESVGGLTIRGVALAASHVRGALERALTIVDDIGLTCGAAAAAPWPYWRGLVPAERNARCPCRVGRKAKNCGHWWGAARAA